MIIVHEEYIFDEIFCCGSRFRGNHSIPLEEDFQGQEPEVYQKELESSIKRQIMKFNNMRAELAFRATLESGQMPRWC